MLAKQLTFGFNETEDRLVLIARDGHDKAVAFALTRRLTGRLINGLATVLERSNTFASTAPAEMRDDIILMEHQGALSGTGEEQPDTSGAWSSGEGTLRLNAPAHLVTKIDIKTAPTDFQILLHTNDGVQIGTKLNRVDLHRVVEVIKRKAEAADWNIQIGALWLEADQTDLVLN
jgi:hypothetical protein